MLHIRGKADPLSKISVTGAVSGRGGGVSYPELESRGFVREFLMTVFHVVGHAP
jgi:hypothetical protein